MPFVNARKERTAIFLTFVFMGGAVLAQPAPKRDGVNGCSIAEVETESGLVWRHTIELQVPKDGYCRVYIGDDKDRKIWKYCWLKRAPDKPGVGDLRRSSRREELRRLES